MILDLLLIFAFFKAEPCSHERRMQNHINLIEGQPIFDQALIAGKESPAETLVKFQHETTSPTTILLKADSSITQDKDACAIFKSVKSIIDTACEEINKGLPAVLEKLKSEIGEANARNPEEDCI